jgi:hypothetical protein
MLIFYYIFFITIFLIVAQPMPQKMKSALCTLLTCCAFSTPLRATEGGGSNYLPGFYGDFGMAVFSTPGTYFNNFFAAYEDIRSDTDTLLEMPGIIHVSDFQIFNGQFVAGVYPGMLASKDHSGSNDLARVGLGDFYFVPGGLAWTHENLSVFLFEGVVAPTGRYEKGELNSGRNYWTFDHNLQLTLGLPLNTEFSLGVGLMNNLKNTATDYRSGDELHIDYNFGYYLRPNIGFGVTGSYYKQLNKDISDDTATQVFESGEASTIGPVVLYTPKINDKDVTISLKWLKEFDVTSRVAQEYLICRLLMSF